MHTEMAAEASRGKQLATVTNGIVALHRKFYGKGPVKAKTFAVNDTVLTVLHGGFTTVEETLIADGKGTEVEAVRRSFQGTMRVRFTAVVEAALGRKVVGYMSQVSTEPMAAVELFMLEPSDPSHEPPQHEE